MASNFPASLDTGSTTLRTDIASGKEHDVQHVNSNDANIELQKKVGISASLPTAIGDILVCTALGTGAAGDTTIWKQPAEGTSILQVQVFS